jgi:hypothetical protein
VRRGSTGFTTSSNRNPFEGTKALGGIEDHDEQAAANRDTRWLFRSGFKVTSISLSLNCTGLFHGLEEKNGERREIARPSPGSRSMSLRLAAQPGTLGNLKDMRCSILYSLVEIRLIVCWSPTEQPSKGSLEISVYYGAASVR